MALEMSSKGTPLDRRRHERLTTYFAAVLSVSDSGNRNIGMVRNLSVAGAMVEAEWSAAVGEELRLTFFLPNGFAVNTVGTVRWRNLDSGVMQRMGLEINLASQALEEVERLTQAG